MRALKAKANEAFGLVLIAIPNVGATSFKPMDGLPGEEVDWIVQVNFMGVMNFIQLFLPDMIAAGDGHIVASASVAELILDFVPAHVPYSGAKARVIGMMLNLRRELEGTRVQSTAVCVASNEATEVHSRLRAPCLKRHGLEAFHRGGGRYGGIRD